MHQNILIIIWNPMPAAAIIAAVLLIMTVEITAS